MGCSPPKVSQASEAWTAAVMRDLPDAPGEATRLPGSLSLEQQRHLEAGVEPQVTRATNNQLAQESRAGGAAGFSTPWRCTLFLPFLQETTTHPMSQQGEPWPERNQMPRGPGFP